MKNLEDFTLDPGDGIQRNYIAKLDSIIQGGGIDTINSSIYQITIAHDDDCPILNGSLSCTCDPEIEISLKGQIAIN